MTDYQYDYLVLGGGSGGIASARRAAEYGARAAVVEAQRMGGTCVNVGCVPKKVMWNTSRVAEYLHDAPGYGFDVTIKGFDWQTIKTARDDHIARLNQIYQRNMDQAGVDTIRGYGRLVEPQVVIVGEDSYSAEHVLIATGGRPVIPDLPGADLGITSDGFFELTQQPRRLAVVGAGYIATEFAGLMSGLGTEVVQVLRKDRILRNFDRQVTAVVMDHMRATGVHFETDFDSAGLEKNAAGGLRLWSASKQSIDDLDCVIWAIGREPNIDAVDLPGSGVALDEDGFIATDRYQNTRAMGIYAVGDVAGRAELTPVAIAAGRRLADRLFGGQPDARLDYENIPTVVFSHPPIGTVGMSEEQAIETFGKDRVTVYSSRFSNLYYAVIERDAPTLVKLVVTNDDDRVVGCHLTGDFADEIIQGFAVAIKMGARKQDFDRTVAIHPTAAEELVTLR